MAVTTLSSPSSASGCPTPSSERLGTSTKKISSLSEERNDTLMQFGSILNHFEKQMRRQLEDRAVGSALISARYAALQPGSGTDY